MKYSNMSVTELGRCGSGSKFPEGARQRKITVVRSYSGWGDTEVWLWVSGHRGRKSQSQGDELEQPETEDRKHCNWESLGLSQAHPGHTDRGSAGRKIIILSSTNFRSESKHVFLGIMNEKRGRE